MPKFILTDRFLVAIVFVPVGFEGENGKKEYSCKKYRHNIKNTDHYISKFCRDMKAKFPDAEYINFYYKDTGSFKERIHLE